MKSKFRLPPRSEIARLVRSIRADIQPDYRAFEGDETPGIQLTIGASPDGTCSVDDCTPMADAIAALKARNLVNPALIALRHSCSKGVPIVEVVR